MKKFSWMLLRLGLTLFVVVASAADDPTIEAKRAAAQSLRELMFQVDEDEFIRAAAEGGTNETVMLAVPAGDVIVLQLFLTAGIKVDARSYNERITALMATSARGNYKAVSFLLGKGAEVNAKDRRGRNALMFAARGGSAETVTMLIEKGAQPNQTDEDGKSPLIYAAQAGNHAALKALLANRADPDIRDNKGETALNYARNEGRANLIETLIACTTVGVAGIDGAFGLKLGDVFDVESGKQVGANEYEFVPQGKVSNLSRYSVNVTPTTHKIVAINAWALESEFPKDQIDVIVAALIKKYGGTPQQSGFVLYRREIGDRTILFHLYGTNLKQGDALPEHRIGITYIDRRVDEIAGREIAAASKSEAESKQRELDNKAKALETSGL